MKDWMVFVHGFRAFEPVQAGNLQAPLNASVNRLGIHFEYSCLP